MTPIGTWQQQVNFVRGMPSVAAKILLILMMSGKSITNKDLMFACDASDKTISTGLAWLEFNEIIQNNGKYNGWSLTATARQLSLNLSLSKSENPTTSRKISDLLPSSSSSKDLNNLDLDEEERKNVTTITEIPHFDEALKSILVSAGIGSRSPALRELLAADLDIDWVKAHIDARKQLRHSGEHYPVGWLIQKLRCGDPVPDLPNSANPYDAYDDIIKR